MSIPAEKHLAADIADELKEDASGEFKMQLRNKFIDQVSAIDTLLKAGVSPEEYTRLNTIKQGLQSANVVLERVWLYHHQ